MDKLGTKQGQVEGIAYGLGVTNKNLPQTPAEISANNAVRKETRVYKAKHEARSEYLAHLVQRGMNAIADHESLVKFPLSNTERLKEQSMVYMQTCMDDGILPDFQSYCMSLGYSKSGVNGYISRTEEGDPSRDWLVMMKELFSSLLSQAALSDDVNTIFAIFAQKALYDWRENQTVTIVTDNPLGAPKTEAEIEKMNKRYMQDAVYEEIE